MLTTIYVTFENQVLAELPREEAVKAFCIFFGALELHCTETLPQGEAKRGVRCGRHCRHNLGGGEPLMG